MNLRTIHPFPARMAPEIALSETARLRKGSTVLDPMAGSGMTIRVASDRGHRAVGFDIDPLAVLMTKVWTTPICTKRLRLIGTKFVDSAHKMKSSEVILPWVDGDDETKEFIEYWFGSTQIRDLRKLSSLLATMPGQTGDALRLALSRTIITKKRGASLAWDVSHSRPHKVAEENDYSVIDGFLKSVEKLASLFDEYPPRGNTHVRRGDAKQLRGVSDESVDAVITSPPYLDAIDYLRGHKLALVWFGHSISQLRRTRSVSVGSQRILGPDERETLARELCASLIGMEDLTQRQQGMVHRYALDLFSVMTEIHRVLRPSGKAVFVVGSSCIKGVHVENAHIVAAAARRAGLKEISRTERELPANKRYLPPPNSNERSDLGKRMKTETILKFKKPR